MYIRQFGAFGDLPRIPIGDAFDVGARVFSDEPTDASGSVRRKLPGTFAPVRPSIPPLGPPPSFDDSGEKDEGGKEPEAQKESPQIAKQPWYKSPWPWVSIAAVLAAAVGYLALRQRRGRGFGDLREKLRESRLIVPDLKNGLYYIWRGGNALCVVDGQGRELECFSTAEPTIQAARDLAYQKILAYYEPGREH